MSENYILSIDLGSTNLKAALFNENLDRLYGLSLPLAYDSKESSKYEFSSKRSWTTIIELINKLIIEADIKSCDIKYISVDSQATTFALFNSSTLFSVNA